MSQYIKPVKYTQETYLENEVRNLRIQLTSVETQAAKMGRELNTLRAFVGERKLIDEFLAWRVAQRMEDK